MESFNELALFAGAGGGILGGKILGWRTVCAVEYEPYAACVLAQRQNDGLLPTFPIWDDVRSFDGKPWRGIVDVVSGGFPCQDISAAGKGAGIEGDRSGLWVEMARIIGEVQPKYAFVENSPVLTSRGLGVVLGDLAAMGYDARWGVLGASDVGAPHKRERIWIVANSRYSEPRQQKSAIQQKSKITEREVIGNVCSNITNSDSDTIRKQQRRQHGQRRAKRAVKPEHNGELRYVADSNSLRELQSERREQDKRRWVGDGGEEVSDANEKRPPQQKEIG